MVGDDCSVVASCPWLLIYFILMLDFTLLLPSVDGGTVLCLKVNRHFVSIIWQFCSNLALISPSFFSVLPREDHVEGRQHYLAAECVQLRREWRCLQTSTFVEGIGFCFSKEIKCLCL